MREVLTLLIDSRAILSSRPSPVALKFYELLTTMSDDALIEVDGYYQAILEANIRGPGKSGSFQLLLGKSGAFELLGAIMLYIAEHGDDDKNFWDYVIMSKTMSKPKNKRKSKRKGK